MIYIFNATPIIAFAKIGKFNLIRDLCGQIILPEAVYKELTAFGQDRPGAKEIMNAEWVLIEKVTNQEYVRFLSTNLDIGEAEVIALAYEKKAHLAVIDEKTARRIAVQIGIDVIGSIGILIKAKNLGIITQVKSYWDEMMQCGIRYNPEFYHTVLKRLGEIG